MIPAMKAAMARQARESAEAKRRAEVLRTAPEVGLTKPQREMISSVQKPTMYRPTVAEKRRRTATYKFERLPLAEKRKIIIERKRMEAILKKKQEELEKKAKSEVGGFVYRGVVLDAHKVSSRDLFKIGKFNENIISDYEKAIGRPATEREKAEILTISEPMAKNIIARNKAIYKSFGERRYVKTDEYKAVEKELAKNTAVQDYSKTFYGKKFESLGVEEQQKVVDAAKNVVMTESGPMTMTTKGLEELKDYATVFKETPSKVKGLLETIEQKYPVKESLTTFLPKPSEMVSATYYKPEFKVTEAGKVEWAGAVAPTAQQERGLAIAQKKLSEQIAKAKALEELKPKTTYGTMQIYYEPKPSGETPFPYKLDITPGEIERTEFPFRAEAEGAKEWLYNLVPEPTLKPKEERLTREQLLEKGLLSKEGLEELKTEGEYLGTAALGAFPKLGGFIIEKGTRAVDILGESEKLKREGRYAESLFAPTRRTAFEVTAFAGGIATEALRSPVKTGVEFATLGLGFKALRGAKKIVRPETVTTYYKPGTKLISFEKWKMPKMRTTEFAEWKTTFRPKGEFVEQPQLAYQQEYTYSKIPRIKTEPTGEVTFETVKGKPQFEIYEAVREKIPEGRRIQETPKDMFEDITAEKALAEKKIPTEKPVDEFAIETQPIQADYGLFEFKAKRTPLTGVTVGLEAKPTLKLKTGVEVFKEGKRGVIRRTVSKEFSGIKLIKEEAPFFKRFTKEAPRELTITRTEFEKVPGVKGKFTARELGIDTYGMGKKGVLEIPMERQATLEIREMIEPIEKPVDKIAIYDFYKRGKIVDRLFLRASESGVDVWKYSFTKDTWIKTKKVIRKYEPIEGGEFVNPVTGEVSKLAPRNIRQTSTTNLELFKEEMDAYAIKRGMSVQRSVEINIKPERSIKPETLSKADPFKKYKEIEYAPDEVTVTKDGQKQIVKSKELINKKVSETSPLWKSREIVRIMEESKVEQQAEPSVVLSDVGQAIQSPGLEFVPGRGVGAIPSITPFLGISAKAEPRIEPRLEPKAEPRLEPKLEPMLEPALEPSLEPKLEPKVEPLLEPMLEPLTEPALEPKLRIGVTPEPIISEPITPMFVIPSGKRKFKETPKRKQSYQAYVKEKRKFIKVGKPTSKDEALDLGSQIVDESASGTFKIMKSNKKPKRNLISTPGFFKTNKTKFRSYEIRKGKKKRLIDKWIEKEGSRIDTSGEIRGITARGWVAERKKKSRFGIPKVTTNKRRSKLTLW